MEKEKANLNVKIEVKSTNYQNGNVMEAEGKLKTVFGGRGQVTEDSLSFKGSDCGKASMEANYNSSATGEGEKNTEVELDIKGGIINEKKELIDAIAAGSKLTKADAGRELGVKTEDWFKLKMDNSCDTKCANTESFYTTKTSEISKQ